MNFIKKNMICFGVLFGFSIIYILTMYPGVGGRINYGDSAKWQFLWAIGGTPHSTGYPLYLFISKIFGNFLFFLEPSSRITLISLASALGTLFTVCKISEIFIEHKNSRILPMFILGSCYTFWSQATEAEVYTLNTFFVSLVIYYAIKFYQTKENKFIFITVFVYSVSFGNHLSMITILPALIYIVAISDYRLFLRKKIILYSIFFVFLGFSQYTYLLYLSHSGSPYLEYIGENATLKHWFSYITGGQFRASLGGNNTFDKLFNSGMPGFLIELWKNLGWAIATVTLFLVFRQKTVATKSNRIVIFLALIALFELANSITYDIPDIVVYYIPVFLVLSLLIPKTIDLLDSKNDRNVLVVGLLLIGLLFAVINYKKLQVKHTPYEDNVRIYFNLLPEHSIIYIPKTGFYSYIGFQSLKYAEYVEFAGKDISHISSINGILQKDLYTLSEFIAEVPEQFYIVEKKESTLVDLIDNNFNDIIIFSGKDDSVAGLTETTKKDLARFGLNLAKLEFRGSYVALISNGKVIQEIINNSGPIILKDKTLEGFEINEISSAGGNFGNYSKIICDGAQLSLNKRGLNVVVLKRNGHHESYNVDSYITDKFEPILYKLIPNNYKSAKSLSFKARAS